MSSWTDICHSDEILPNIGRCALYEGEQVAIFKVDHGEGESLFAVSNFCPFSQANTLSRGIVGCLSEVLVVASPLYKQHFELSTGKCIEDNSVSIKTYKVRVDGEFIQLAA